MNLLVQDMATVLGSFGVAFYLSWKLTMVVVAGLPVAVAIVPFISSRIQRNNTQQNYKMTEAVKIIMSTIEAIETVKCYNGEAFQLWKYATILKDAAHYLDRQSFWNALQMGTMRFTTHAMFVQGFWFSIILLDNGKITGSEVLTSFWAAVQGLQALIIIISQMAILEKGRAAGHLLRAIMCYVDKHQREDDAVAADQPEKCAGDIVFEKVCQILRYSTIGLTKEGLLCISHKTVATGHEEY